MKAPLLTKNFFPLMNAAIQQILAGKTQKHPGTTLTIKTIGKPKTVGPALCSISVSGDSLFYTYDGRALFFSADQNKPVMSLPDETKKVIFLKAGSESFLLMLSSKNKLECCDFTPTLNDSRYIVTRNVLQVEESCGKVFFIFKKDTLFFINECCFNGKKWIGQAVLPGIEASNARLFASNGTFFYISDFDVFDCTGAKLGIRVDFVHLFGDMMVTGFQQDMAYEIKLLNTRNEYVVLDECNIPGRNIGRVVAHGDVVIIQNSNDLNIFRINTKQGCFYVKYVITCRYAVMGYDFTVDDGLITLSILTESKHPKFTVDISNSNIISEMEDTKLKDKIKPITSSGENTISDTLKDKNDELTSKYKLDAVSYNSKVISDSDFLNRLNAGLTPTPTSTANKRSNDEDITDPDFFCNTIPARKSSILREMESMSLTPPNMSVPVPEFKPKSNLLEEVRAALNKQKLDVLDKPIYCPRKNSSESLEDINKGQLNAGSPNEKLGNSIEQPTVSKSINNAKGQPNAGSPNEKLGNPIEQPTVSKNTSNKGVRDRGVNLETYLTNFSYENFTDKTDRSLGINKNGEPQSNLLEAMAAIQRDICDIKRSQKEISAALTASGFKNDQIKILIKQSILETLVPCVEGCFNEMRIQMQTEVKKLFSSIGGVITDSKVCLVKKHLQNGKIAQAISELLKLDDKELTANISLLAPSYIDNINSEIIVQLLKRIHQLIQQSSSIICPDLVYACLVDLEIDELSAKQLQELSPILKNMVGMEAFSKDKWPNLFHAAEIVSKRISKRIRRENLK